MISGYESIGTRYRLLYEVSAAKCEITSEQFDGTIIMLHTRFPRGSNRDTRDRNAIIALGNVLFFLFFVFRKSNAAYGSPAL